MRLSSSLFVLSALFYASLTSALVFPSLLKRNYTAVWPVTGFNLGCSPGGCVYEFNVSAPVTYSLNQSSFATSCQGAIGADHLNYQRSVANCTDSTVLWKLDIYDTYNQISVTHAWNIYDGKYKCTYNITGSQALTKDQTGNFDIDNVKVWAICWMPSRHTNTVQIAGLTICFSSHEIEWFSMYSFSTVGYFA